MKSKCFFCTHSLASEKSGYLWYLALISLKLKDCVQQVYPLKGLCSFSILLIVVNFCQLFLLKQAFQLADVQENLALNCNFEIFILSTSI